MSASRGRLARELAAEVLAHLVDVPPEHAAVGAREVDVLEDAVVPGRGGNGRTDSTPVVADDDDLARLDLALVVGVDQVERAGLRGDDDRLARRAPCTSGRKPYGSRAAMTRSSVRNTSE